MGGTVKNKSEFAIYTFSGPANVSSNVQAETEAILHVLSIVSKMNISKGRVVICSDSTEAISVTSKGLEAHLSDKIPPQEVKSLLESYVYLQFVPRELNEDADSLAKDGLKRGFLAQHWSPSVRGL